MPKALCPECGEEIVLAPEEVLLYSNLHCDECGAMFEIVRENPLTVASIAAGPEEHGYDDDFNDDDGL